MFYRAICEQVNGQRKLYPVDKHPREYVSGGQFKEYFSSIFKYNEEQKQRIEETGSTRGIQEVVSNWLVFDFDAQDLELARQDTIKVCQRLAEEYGIPEESLNIFFSGNKGYHIEVHTKQDITVAQFKAITKAVAGDCPTFDTKINDPQRIFRLGNTVNIKSGLYKVRLSPEQLVELSIEQMKELAKKPGSVLKYQEIDLPKKLANLKVEEVKKEVVKVNTDGIDWTIKPRWMPNCKYSLQNGYFAEGDRNSVFFSLAGTYKAQGFSEEITYRMLKGVAEQQATKNDCDRYPDAQLYNNIIKQVYSPLFNGGQGTCKTEGWLQDYCNGLGVNKCQHRATDSLIGTDQVFNLFKDYSEKYENNVLFSGIKSLDDRMKFMVGTSNGILAPPGVGKTSLCLQILEFNSKQDVPCLFYSYDMFHSALYMRMMQRDTGIQQDEIYKAFKEDPNQVIEWAQSLNEKYKNVQFCFKAGQTIDELEATIDEAEQKLGRKPKMVIVDYNELVMTDVSDSTASSAVVAQRLRQIANTKEVCIITLLQPAKQFCSPADEITNFNSVKGSSAIVQSLTLLLGCSRPGFDPLNPEQDRFFNITCLKNRNGPLFSVDFSWEGLTGRIGSLNANDVNQLRDIRDSKRAQDGGLG